jgi:hypothetical protein
MRLVRSVESFDQKVGTAYLVPALCFFMLRKTLPLPSRCSPPQTVAVASEWVLLSTCGETPILRVGSSLIIAGVNLLAGEDLESW